MGCGLFYIRLFFFFTLSSDFAHVLSLNGNSGFPPPPIPWTNDIFSTLLSSPQSRLPNPASCSLIDLYGLLSFIQSHQTSTTGIKLFSISKPATTSDTTAQSMLLTRKPETQIGEIPPLPQSPASPLPLSPVPSLSPSLLSLSLPLPPTAVINAPMVNTAVPLDAQLPNIQKKQREKRSANTTDGNATGLSSKRQRFDQTLSLL